MSFYKEYFKYDGQEANQYKEDFIRTKLQEGFLYKFISFNDDKLLNDIKLRCINRETVWLSHYKYFEDATELKVPLNYVRVSSATGRTVYNLRFLFDSLREIYDICCFTTRVDDYMWSSYANDGSGICLCFEVIDYDKYFPIEYVKKEVVDLTESAIKSINDNASGTGFNSRAFKEVSVLPVVLKDKKYEEECEIRLMHSPFDDEEGFFGGIVRPDVKDEYSYKGTELKYDCIDLKLSRVIIGRNLNDVLRTRIENILVDLELDIVYC